MRILMLLLLTLHPLHAAELLTTSTPTPIQPTDSPISAAAAWAAIPNKADPLFLDHFIARYPQSDEAEVAFTLRFNGVQTSRSIPEYQAFITKYTGTLAAEQALYELFELYQQQNTLAGYFDFIKRYSNTPQAVVARLHLETLAFELASRLDTVADYDSFIALFPNAAQVSAVEQLAQKKLAALEKVHLDNELTRLKRRLSEEQQAMKTIEARLETELVLDDDFWEQLDAIQASITGLTEDIQMATEKRAAELATRLESEASSAEAVLDDNSLTEAEKNQQIQYHWRMAQRYVVLLRSKHYRQTQAAKRVRLEERHQRVLDKLEAIRLALKSSNEALITALQQEFAKTRETLRAGFARLHLDNVLLNQSLQQLVSSVEVLHQDIAEINRNLVTIHQGLSDVQATIKQTHVHLMVLHEDLDRVRGRLIQLNQDMNQGMEKQKTLLRAVAGSVKHGFAQLHTDMEARQLQTAALHQEKLSLANRQLYANQRIAKVLEKTHQQSLAQRAQQTQQLRRSIQSQRDSIVNAQSLTFQAVEHQTDVMIYSTDQLLASDRQTRGLISQQTQQIVQIEAQKKQAETTGLFKDIISIAANSFVPGLGAMAGPLVDAVSDVVQGKDIGTALISGAKGFVAEQCPQCAPAMDIAEGLVQGKSPQQVLITTAKQQLGQHCQECTPFVDIADGLLQGKKPWQVIENVASTQIGKHCPECVPVWQTAKGLAQGEAPEKLLTELVGDQIAEQCPDCQPAVQTIQGLMAGQPIETVLQNHIGDAVKTYCPNCGPVVKIAQQLQSGDSIETILGQAAMQTLTNNCPECLPAVEAVHQFANGQSPVAILKQTVAKPLQAACPNCGNMVKVAEDLLSGQQLNEIAQTQLAAVCPKCVPTWKTVEQLLQAKDAKTVLSTQISQQITAHCPNCTPVLQTMQQLAQGKPPLELVIETTEQRLAQDCPECGQILQTIIPIAQQEAINAKQTLLTQLQAQIGPQAISEQPNNPLNDAIKRLMP
jgi:uncharacterized Zn finger protein